MNISTLLKCALFVGIVSGVSVHAHGSIGHGPLEFRDLALAVAEELNVPEGSRAAYVDDMMKEFAGRCFDQYDAVKYLANKGFTLVKNFGPYSEAKYFAKSVAYQAALRLGHAALAAKNGIEKHPYIAAAAVAAAGALAYWYYTPKKSDASDKQ